ncbi:Polycystin-1 [Nymphon striatum]|nr:Polycystin-1 [Nymphon striatum]
MCPACTSVWVRDLGNYRYPVEKIGECPTQYGKKDPRLDNSLGMIQKVNVWINNSGISPSWFVSHIFITDLDKELVYYFNANKWLSVEKNDEITVETEFSTTPICEHKGFRDAFWDNLLKEIISRHHLLSIWFMKHQDLEMGYVVQWKCVVVGIITSLAFVTWHSFISTFLQSFTAFIGQKFNFSEVKNFKSSDLSVCTANYDLVTGNEVVEYLLNVRLDTKFFQRCNDSMNKLNLKNENETEDMLTAREKSDYKVLDLNSSIIDGSQSSNTRIINSSPIITDNLHEERMENYDAHIPCNEFAIDKSDNKPAKNEKVLNSASKKCEKVNIHSSNPDMEDINSQFPHISKRNTFLYKFIYPTTFILIGMGCISISVVILINYAYRLTPANNLMWLQSCYFAVIISLTIVQPLFSSCKEGKIVEKRNFGLLSFKNVMKCENRVGRELQKFIFINNLSIAFSILPSMSNSTQQCDQIERLCWIAAELPQMFQPFHGTSTNKVSFIYFKFSSLQ